MSLSRHIRQFMTLAHLTALDTLRQPICLLLTLTCIACTLIVPLAIAQELGEQGRMARDGSLAFHFFIGLLLAGYAACASFRREIHTGVLSTVLSKSVSRSLFFIAKFTGISAVIFLFSLCAGLSTLLAHRLTPIFYELDTLAIRIGLIAPVLALAGAGLDNFISRRPFAAHAMIYLIAGLGMALAVVAMFDRQGSLVSWGSACDWRTIPASLLITVALVIFGGLALLFAIRLDTVPVLALCIVLFAAGLLRSYLFEHLFPLQILLPDWQLFWQADALANDHRIPWIQVFETTRYGIIYLAGILCLGIVLFRQSELE